MRHNEKDERKRERHEGRNEERKREPSAETVEGGGARSDEQSTHEEEIRRGEKKSRNGRHGENKEGGWRQDAREIREKISRELSHGGGRRKKERGKGNAGREEKQRAGAEE